VKITVSDLRKSKLLLDPCDKEELCAISSFTTSPQLDGEHTLVSCSTPNILQENVIQLALSEETIPEPSPTCENKNCIAEIPFVVCSAMSNFAHNKKDLSTQPIVVGSEKDKSICSELDHVNDETHSLTVDPCEPITLVLNLSTTPASLEQSLVEPVAEFPLLQDIIRLFLMTKKSCVIMLYLNDEDITNMDTPTVVAYNSKVKLFFSIIIFNTCDEWMLHHDVFNVIYRSTYMDQRRCGSCMERIDYEIPGLGTNSKCSLRFNQVTTLLVL
jgi:hypothetical protein